MPVTTCLSDDTYQDCRESRTALQGRPVNDQSALDTLAKILLLGTPAFIAPPIDQVVKHLARVEQGTPRVLTKSINSSLEHIVSMQFAHPLARSPWKGNAA